MDSASISQAEMVALRRAIELAGRGAGPALPNPVVGCVLLGPGGVVVGEGFHARAGGPHAEVVALTAAGPAAHGATAVVTLEPCNHAGRTGPCSEALIAAGVARVLAAVRDPWAPAAGGIDRLRAAGIDVVPLWSGENPDPAANHLAEAAQDVNRVWLTATRWHRPFVTFKAGVTLDGRVAAPDGSSRWITSTESRADVHRLRAQVDTMMVGVGTVLADDPQLTVRGPDGPPDGRQPLRVVIDSLGRTPERARVRDDAAETLIATAGRFGADVHGRVQVAAVLHQLYADDRRHVLLEGGPRLAASMIETGLVDEVLLYLAPLLLGAGRSVLEGRGISTLAEARRATLMDLTRIGPDVRLRYRLLAG